MAKPQSLIAASPGFCGMEVRPSHHDSSDYLLIVHWDDIESHAEGFRESDRYAEWRDLLHHFYDPVPSVEYFGESIIS